MSESLSIPQAPAPRADPTGGTNADESLIQRLDDAFGQRFILLDADHGVIERISDDWPGVDPFRWQTLCEQLIRRGRVEILEDCAPLTLLAAPIATPSGDEWVALTILVTDRVEGREDVEAAARAFGVDAQKLLQWMPGRAVWPPQPAIELASTLIDNHRMQRALRNQKAQLSDVSAHLLATFDELDLLHRLTERLSLGRETQRLAAETLTWLADVVPAECVVAQWIDDTPSNDPGDGPPDGASALQTAVLGKLPIDVKELNQFWDRLGSQTSRRAVVLNRDQTSSPTWEYPGVREVAAAPILEGGRPVAWLAAFNCRRSSRGGKPASDTGVFGSVEASLLSSVAAILGVHHGNRRLFSEQQELFDGAVHAFSSALDAKDPYTRGHSDRVAQIAVCLAERLGVSEDEKRTLRLGGLLHDIGKIGIDDSVLRKPDRLTEEEYEHIKQHPELGERILADVPQLAGVLPVVRNHHESWDGTGYPDGLSADATPLLARIVAVADSIDAMGGDRPYRAGMPHEMVEGILREGAGRQWDPQVIDAYFEVREQVYAILETQRDSFGFDSPVAAEPIAVGG